MVNYWKIKAQLLQFQLEEINIRNLLDDVIKRRIEYCKENRLPLNNLRFDDTQQTIEEIHNNGGQTTGRNT